MRLAKAAELFCFNPRALTSPDKRSRWSFFREQSFNPRALTSPDHDRVTFPVVGKGFNPRALTSPDEFLEIFPNDDEVSIHWLLRALTSLCGMHHRSHSFNPRALTSPDGNFKQTIY